MLPAQSTAVVSLAMRTATALIVSTLALAAACSPPTAGQAQTTGRLQDTGPTGQVPTSATQMRLSFAPVARRVSPAVVNIASRQVVRDPRAEAYFQMFGQQPRERVAQSLGSGAIVRPDGVIITNAHVIGGNAQGVDVLVTLPDRREFPARVLLVDTRSDLAVLKIDVPRGEQLPVLNIDERQALEVGDLVLAVGDPFGVGQTVTSGIVSAVNRTEFGPLAAQAGGSGEAAPVGSFIQTDAAINPGNSGGPLVDMDGDLIGINTFILSGSGASAGVGFAIPAALVRRVVDTALGGRSTFARPWLGARVQPVTGEAAPALGLNAPRGVVVTQVYPDSSAARAGIQQGDVILAVDGQGVNDESALNFRLTTEAPGAQANLRVLRARTERDLRVRLEAPPERPARDQRVLSAGQPLAGVTVVNLNPAIADQYSLDPFGRGGPLILALPGSSFAAQAGFRPGDVIRTVNDRQIASTADLATALNGSGPWRIVVERQGRLIGGDFG